jgi:hypothetical protein
LELEQLAVRHSKTLESIVDSFEQFDQCLPRFQYYIEAFGSWHSTERFRRSVVRYYAELIKQCQEALHFLRSNQISKEGKHYYSRISRLNYGQKTSAYWVAHRGFLIANQLREFTDSTLSPPG